MSRESKKQSFGTRGPGGGPPGMEWECPLKKQRILKVR